VDCDHDAAGALTAIIPDNGTLGDTGALVIIGGDDVIASGADVGLSVVEAPVFAWPEAGAAAAVGALITGWLEGEALGTAGALVTAWPVCPAGLLVPAELPRYGIPNSSVKIANVTAFFICWFLFPLISVPGPLARWTRQ